MAPKKLPAKRSRKDATREGSSAALQAGMDFDGHKFRIVEHQQRFEAIKGWSFLRDGRVQLRDEEYAEFQEEIWCNPTSQGHWIEDSKKIGQKMQEKALGFSWALGLISGPWAKYEPTYLCKY